jgi:hypothetical protein
MYFMYLNGNRTMELIEIILSRRRSMRENGGG